MYQPTTPLDITELNRLSYEELKEQIVLWRTNFIKLKDELEWHITSDGDPTYPGDNGRLKEELFEKDACMIRTVDGIEEILDTFSDKFCE